MKKFIILIFLIYFGFFMQSVSATEKITSVNYDTSANMLFLTSNSVTSPNTPVKLIRLSNPNRVYFDIEDAVLTAEKQNFQVSSGGHLRQVVVSQNSTNPNVVRVVLYFAEAYNTSNLKILRLNGNIIAKFNNDICSQANYMKTAYRDNKFDNTDYYSFIAMQSQTVTAVDTPLVNSVQGSEKVLNQIQQAFNNSTIPVNVKTSYQNPNVSVVRKIFRLQSKFYLTSVQAKQNGILLNGFGNVAVEKPMVLSSPNRLVFDLPNTVSASELRSKVFQYGTDTVRIGQFEANKARIVVTTPNPDNYIPIYSADGQSVLIADKEKLNHTQLTAMRTNLTSVKFTKTDDLNFGLNFYFTKPVVYSVKRTDNNLTIYFFNAVQYNEQDFRSVVTNSNMPESKMYLMPQIGLRYTLPVTQKDSIKVYSGADSRTIKLSMTIPETQKKQQIPDVSTVLPTKVPSDTTEKDNKIEIPKVIRKNGDKVVVIDPGHGGTDYGAIRSGINEKDITTEISQRVTAILRSKGYKVYMTRDEDKTVSLQERVDFSEGISPDIFVSIHVNSSNGTEASGIETHYYHDYSIGLAKTVHNSMAAAINSKDRGLFKSKFYVINHTTVPAILVEIGFISNEEERADLISEKRKKATAKSIAEGIIEYYKQQEKQK